MPSFLDKLRAGTVRGLDLSRDGCVAIEAPKSTGMTREFLANARQATGSSSTTPGAGKKDPKEAHLTWLQKLQQDADPIRPDGSDKFFGAENVGSLP
jgi:hypothetical protein